MPNDKTDKRLVLMITSFQGSRFINVNMIFRQVSYYVLSFVLTLAVFAFSTIAVINKEISNTKERNENLVSQFSQMQKYNAELNLLMQQKDEEIALIGNRFESIEGDIGLKIVGADSKDFRDFIESSGNSTQNTRRNQTQNLDKNTTQNSSQNQTKSEAQKQNPSAQNLEKNADIIKRMDLASISALQKSLIMKFVPNGSPLHGELRISGNFGQRFHPILRVYHMHTGLDLAATIRTPVYASADGVIDWASNFGNGGYGKLVKISHAFGFRTYYAHLSEIKVQRGEFVKRGQLIALSGSSGASTGPHLHYEIRFLGQPLDPINFVRWNMQNFDLIFERERRVSWHSLVEIINNLMVKRQVELPR